MHFLKFSILIGLISFTLSANAEWTGSCGKQEAGYAYCIHRDTESKSKEVLYVLHGGGGDENAWSTLSVLQDTWKNSSLQSPVVITVSFGQMWLLVQRNESPRSGLLDAFASQVMPTLENLALNQAAESRSLLGFSMGGFNGIQLLMHTPPETFKKAALVCPALVELAPWASDEEVAAKAKELGVSFDEVDNIRGIGQAFISSDEVWNKSVSPYALAEEKLGPLTAKTLVAVNIKDKLFNKGGKTFAQTMVSTGANTELQNWPGSHCELNVSKLKEFLQN